MSYYDVIFMITVQIFTNACRRAKPACYPERIISKAFDVAFQSLRYSYGYFGPIEILGTEEETLYDFIRGEILHRELLQDTFNSLRAGPDKASQIQEMQVLANRKVASAVKHTWKRALDATLPLLPDLLSTLKRENSLISQDVPDLREMSNDARDNFLQNMFGCDYFKKFTMTMQLERQIHSKLCAALSGIVDPVIFDAATSVCVPVMESIVLPFRQVYNEAIRGFREDMLVLIKSGELTSRTISRSSGGTITPSLHFNDDISTIGLHDVLSAAHIRVNSGYNSGPLQSARQILWNMYTTNLNSPEVLSCFEGKGLNAYDIYMRVSDSIATLVHNAIFTLGEMLQQAANDPNEEIGGCNPDPASEEIATLLCLDSCVNLMTFDAKVEQHTVLVNIFKRCDNIHIRVLKI